MALLQTKWLSFCLLHHKKEDFYNPIYYTTLRLFAPIFTYCSRLFTGLVLLLALYCIFLCSWILRLFLSCFSRRLCFFSKYPAIIRSTLSQRGMNCTRCSCICHLVVHILDGWFISKTELPGYSNTAILDEISDKSFSDQPGRAFLQDMEYFMLQ